MGRVCAWKIEYVTGEVDFRRGGCLFIEDGM